jgi:hypothetical protein
MCRLTPEAFVIEIAALATSLVTSLLVPLMKSGVEGLMDDLRTKTTEAAATGIVGAADRLWKRVLGKTENTEDEEVLGMFERRPEMMQQAMETVVKRLLQEDPAFHKEASELLEADDAGTGTTRWQIMADVAGVVDARHATIHGGTLAGVQMTASPGLSAPEKPMPSRGE